MGKPEGSLCRSLRCTEIRCLNQQQELFFFKCGQWFFKVRLLGGQAGDLPFSRVVFLSRHIFTKVGLFLCCSLLTIYDKSFEFYYKEKLILASALFTLANDQVNRALRIRVSSFIYQRCLGINYSWDQIPLTVFAFPLVTFHRLMNIYE